MQAKDQIIQAKEMEVSAKSKVVDAKEAEVEHLSEELAAMRLEVKQLQVCIVKFLNSICDTYLIHFAYSHKSLAWNSCVRTKMKLLKQNHWSVESKQR